MYIKKKNLFFSHHFWNQIWSPEGQEWRTPHTHYELQ